MSSPVWTLKLFGGLRVIGSDREIQHFPTKRSALILVRLALSRSGTVSRDELAETLWPDDFLDTTRVRLRQELNRLKEALGPAAVIIEADRTWVKLDFENILIDAREFDRLLGKKDATSDEISKALELYTGALLPEQSEDWVQAQRQEFQMRLLSALTKLSADLLQADRDQEAISFALRAVRSDPLSEAARTVAMRALIKFGDVAGAMRLYTEYDRALDKEYGTRPSEAIQELARSARSKPASAPAPAAAPAPQHEPSAPLPVYLESIVGREHELQMLSEWLAKPNEYRLITITGPGGVGKTRLSVAASSAAKSDSLPVFFISLADIESGKSVRAKIEKAFTDGPTYSDDPLATWGNKRCLLLLDNAEHVIDEARSTAQQILVNHPAVTLLVTSRQRLGLSGEQELPLTPLEGIRISGNRAALEESPAARLFVQRARAARPGYSVADDQIEDLGLLIERLDGLPLSIELAAARIGSLSPDQMLGEIDDRFTFLVSRRADVGPRQRSLRATIEWSFQNLPDELKRTMEVLAVFRSGWILGLAKEATKNSAVYEALQDLMDRSLIYSDETDTGVRFGMLEAIRDYVITELPEKKLVELRSNHAHVIADYLYGFADNLTGPDQDKNFALVRAEMDNARAAMEWSIAKNLPLGGKFGSSLWRVWCARGKPSEGAELLDGLLDEIPADGGVEWGAACGGRGIIGYLMGDDDACAKWFGKSIEIFDRLGLTTRVSWARYNLSRSLIGQGRTKEAAHHLEFALANAMPKNVPSFMLGLGRVYIRLNKSEEAMNIAEEGFARMMTHPDVAAQAVGHATLAEIYAGCGKFDSVQGLCVEGLRRLKAAPVQDYELSLLTELAIEELRQGLLEEFNASCDRALEIARDIHEHNSEITLLGLKAKADKSENKRLALENYFAAFRLALPLGGGIAIMQVARYFARDLLKLGHKEEALKVLGMEAYLRAELETGLTITEQGEMDEIYAELGEEPGPVLVESTRELATKSLAILKGLPVGALV